MSQIMKILLLILANCQISYGIIGKNVYSDIWNSISTDYDSGFRPVVNPNDITYVNISAWLMNVLDVNEAKETIEMMQWVNLQWNDGHLKWSPSDFNGVETIVVPASRLWQPDLNYEEQADDLTTPIDKEDLNAKLKYDGTVSTSHSFVVRLHCPMNVVDFPFDTQTCEFTLTTWQYEGDEVRVNVDTHENNSQQFEESAEWTLLNYFGEQRVTINSGEFYETVWTVILERKPNYYVITLFGPTFVITALCIVGLFSPSNADMHREEKCSLGATALLTMAVVLLMVSDLMPKSETNFPRLGRFIVAEMAMTVVSTMVAVVIMHINTLAEGAEYPPTFWTKLFGLPVLPAKEKSKPSKSNGMSYSNGNGITVPHAKSETMSVLSDEERVTFADIIDTLHELLECERYEALKDARKLCWKRLCLRLDLIAMTFFNTINILMTIGYVWAPQFVF